MPPKSPWENPDRRQRGRFEHMSVPEEGDYRAQRPGNRARLAAFIFGLLLLLLGLSLAFPSNSLFDPYFVRAALILLIFGGAAAYWSRSGLAKLMRMAGIWVIIIACASGFYLLRSDFGDRFLTALVPAEPTVTEGGEIIVYRSNDGHFWVEVSINGAPVKMLIDTGASGVVLNQIDAASAGIDVDGLRYNGKARTANGVALFARTRVAALEIGNRVFENQRVSVNQSAMHGSLLGLSVLNKFSGYEFRGNQLILRP